MTTQIEIGTEIQIGQDFENGLLRLHRYCYSVKVCMLENAGKRGKKVTTFNFVMNVKPRKCDPLFDLTLALTAAKSKEDVLKLVVAVVNGEYNREGEPSVEVSEREERGVDVRPANFNTVAISTSNLYFEADYDSFRIKDKNDPYNEPTCIPPLSAKKRAIKGLHKWASKNQTQILAMTFQEVINEMKAQGIDYHYYCAMD